MLFELAQNAQRTAVEVGDRDGHPVLCLRNGATITPELVEELNQLLADYTPPPPRLPGDEGG